MKILAEFSNRKERDGAEVMPQVFSWPTHSFQPYVKKCLTESLLSIGSKAARNMAILKARGEEV